MLKRGQVVVAVGMRSQCVVEDLLGEGGQAEVYRARVGPEHYALKWYRPGYEAIDARLWMRLKQAINSGAPTEHFLWPFDLVALPHSAQYSGYLMPLKPPEFTSFVDLIAGRIETTFRVLAKAGFQLADSFLRLHAIGLCYQDINFGNIFFNPDTGDIRIADTDNVDINGKRGGIKGTYDFMAPEVGLDLVGPNTMSDRYSLAVLLFRIFMNDSPFLGKRIENLPYDANDPDGTLRTYIREPVFIFDPDNLSNPPLTGADGVVSNLWKIYPQSLRDLFIRAFTRALRDPEARIMENEWRRELCALGDSIFVCPTPGCDTQNFFDLQKARLKQELNPCWACGKPLAYPPRMRFAGSHDHKLVVLSPGAQLFAHHLDGDTYNFTAPLAEVIAHPFGLKNLSTHKWTSRSEEGSMVEVPPQGILPLQSNVRIHFGKTEAEVKL